VAMELGRSAMAMTHSGAGQGPGKGSRKTRRWRRKRWCARWSMRELGAATMAGVQFGGCHGGHGGVCACACACSSEEGD
jgi:hypothetical protein